MATPETRTSQGEAAGFRPAEAEKSARRFITAGWWAQRYRELSWVWRFNLAILVLALLNTAGIRIAGAFGWDSVGAICTVLYAIVVSVWFIVSLVLIALSTKEIFAPQRSRLPPDTGNDA